MIKSSTWWENFSLCYFFFQAEDGIRDIGVTGVQTCALPIFKILSNRKHGADLYRIEVITGREALYYLIRAAETAEGVSESLRVELGELPEAVGSLREEARRAREAAREQTLQEGLKEVSALFESAEAVDGAKAVTGQVVAADGKEIGRAHV